MDRQQKLLLDSICALKIEEKKLSSEILTKLHLLQLLPLSGIENYGVSLRNSLLDQLFADCAKTSKEVTLLKEQFHRLTNSHTKSSQKSSEREILPLVEKMEGRVPVGDYINEEGIIKYTFGYTDTTKEGLPKPFTKKQLDLHNFQVLFRALLNRASLVNINGYEQILDWETIKVQTQLEVAFLTGPEDSTLEDCSLNYIASGAAISLYPHIKGRPYRDGDPICDRYQMKIYQNAVITCLTDGCNWGDKPRKASRIANSKMIAFVEKYLASIYCVSDAIYTLIGSIADAHLSIIDGDEENWSGAKTTANIGVALQLDQNVISNDLLYLFNNTPCDESDRRSIVIPTQWVFVCVNLGDCKVIHYSKSRDCVTDITNVSRNDLLNLSDPGGRLGPYSGIWPDLRNLSVFYELVEEGDIIATMSDGVHDNLDPQVQGYMPRDFNLEYDTWEDIPPAWLSALKSSYLSHFTLYLLKQNPITPQDMKTSLINHAIELTHRSREFLVTNLSGKAPDDYGQYPGKIDHASIGCFRVGKPRDKPDDDKNFIYMEGRTEDKVLLYTKENVIEQVKKDLERLAPQLDSPPTTRMASPVLSPAPTPIIEIPPLSPPSERATGFKLRRFYRTKSDKNKKSKSKKKE